jgi:Bacterial membrane protein YfhO
VSWNPFTTAMAGLGEPRTGESAKPDVPESVLFPPMGLHRLWLYFCLRRRRGEGPGLIDGDPAQVEGLTSLAPLPADGERVRGWIHIASVAWLVGAALAVLAPVLAHGSSFGSYDVLSQFGVLRQPGVVVHNLQAGDQSDQIIPWATLAWTQVHHGQLPLWNPYAALGMPLAFNWQTAAFSVPSLIGYLFPLHLAFTVQVIVTLIIAGTGMYALCRVLRLGTLACVFAGTVFELSGPMLGWLGWPHSAVLSWSGWLFAAALLVVRGQHRLRRITILSLVIAAMVYAGQAEVLALGGLALLVFLVVLLVQRLPGLGGSGPIGRPVLDLSAGVVAGIALGAPLLLPGFQVVSGSQRAVPGGDPAEILKGNPALPAHNLVHIIFQGFDGLPLSSSHWFGYIGGYSETAAYVGVIAVVLAVTALAVRRGRPEVLAFGVLCVVMLAIAFAPPVVAVLSRLPLIGTVLWQRGILPLTFGIAVLAGVGLDALVRSSDSRAVRRWAGGGFVVFALVLIVLLLFGRGDLPADEAAIRAKSFIWPAVEIAVGLGVVVTLTWMHRRSDSDGGSRVSSGATAGRLAGVSLLVCETAFLIAAGAPLWTSTTTPFASTPSMVALKSAVGQSVVGLGRSLCVLPPGLGIPENAQLAYGIQELALYDPMIPSAYYSSWRAVSRESPGLPDDSVYCPGIDSAKLARLYGVSFVVERAGAPGPQGGVFVKAIGDDDLYRIPNAGAATLTPTAVGGRLPPVNAPSEPIGVTHPSPSSWKLRSDAVSPQVLRLRLTDVPGWKATIDGRPVPLQHFAGVMLQLKVPAGRHTIELNYWPATFTIGLVLAGCAVVGLAGAFALTWQRHRATRIDARSSSDP